MAALELDLFSAAPTITVCSSTTGLRGATASIDAPEERPILDALERRGWQLTHILTTHHHGDHVAANASLKERFGLTIIGPKNEASKIPGIDRSVGHGERFDFAGHPVDVIETPGHTSGTSATICPRTGCFSPPIRFSRSMRPSLRGNGRNDVAIAEPAMALPDDTAIYFGHEYTLANAHFAVTVDPENTALKERAAEIEETRSDGGFHRADDDGPSKADKPVPARRRSEDPRAARHGKRRAMAAVLRGNTKAQGQFLNGDSGNDGGGYH